VVREELSCRMKRIDRRAKVRDVEFVPGWALEVTEVPELAEGCAGSAAVDVPLGLAVSRVTVPVPSRSTPLVVMVFESSRLFFLRYATKGVGTAVTKGAACCTSSRRGTIPEYERRRRRFDLVKPLNVMSAFSDAQVELVVAKIERSVDVLSGMEYWGANWRSMGTSEPIVAFF
jgi:hypothetical protein